MINFNDYYYFAQVVESSGITAASRALNLPKSKLSKRISELETRLGARLIQRTSRSFIVTDLGNEFYQHARRMLVEARAAESAVKSRLAEQSGTIRLSSSALVSQLCFSSIIPDFLRRFPKIQVLQEVLNRPGDMINRMSDLFILAHNDALDDSSMIQRRLLVEPLYLVASPNYVATATPVSAPPDLESHQFLALIDAPAHARWDLTHRDPDFHATLHLKPRLVSNDVFALATAVRAGAGIAALPASFCNDDIRRGELVRVLPDWHAGMLTISTLLPSNHGVLPAVRTLLDYIAKKLPAVVTGTSKREPFGGATH